jgi:S-adenosylmethionine hydrolase
LFVAPDNGILTHVYDDETSVEVREIENKQYRLDAEGATFDGRDLFAPAAAWLTRGQAPGTFGRLLREYVKLPIPEPAWEGQQLVGQIVYVDHFGNLISNLTSLHLKEVRGVTRGGKTTIRLGSASIDGVVTSYAGGERDAVRALVNSNGQVEIFVKEGSAAELLKCGLGERITIG